MLRKRIAVVMAASLVASCAARDSASDLAWRRAGVIGLAGAEREAFMREVEACVRREQAAHALPHGPSTTLAVGASGEAPGGSASGLAGVGVMASVLAAGITYRWWKGVGHAGASTAQPGAVEPDAPPAAAGAAAGDVPRATLDGCLDAVTNRWRSDRDTEAAPPR